MGDMGDYWRDHREYVREQKAKARSAIPDAVRVLQTSGIRFEVFNNGEHYRVAGIFDWWPSTGYWRHKSGHPKGYNVKNLLKAVAKSKLSTED